MRVSRQLPSRPMSGLMLPGIKNSLKSNAKQVQTVSAKEAVSARDPTLMTPPWNVDDIRLVYVHLQTQGSIELRPTHSPSGPFCASPRHPSSGSSLSADLFCGIAQFFSSGVCFFTKGKIASSISGKCGANLKDEFAISVVAALEFVTGCKLSLYWSW